MMQKDSPDAQHVGELVISGRAGLQRHTIFYALFGGRLVPSRLVVTLSLGGGGFSGRLGVWGDLGSSSRPVASRLLSQPSPKVQAARAAGSGSVWKTFPQGLNRLRKNSEWTAKGRDLEDAKPSTNPRGSFLGHPGAVHFSRFFEKSSFSAACKALIDFAALRPATHPLGGCPARALLQGWRRSSFSASCQAVPDITSI